LGEALIIVLQIIVMQKTVGGVFVCGFLAFSVGEIDVMSMESLCKRRYDFTKRCGTLTWL